MQLIVYLTFVRKSFQKKFGGDLTSLNDKIKGINKEEITKLISKIPDENDKLRKELTNKLNNLVADYNILVAYYNKKYYKQGFEDATNLIRICGK